MTKIIPVFPLPDTVLFPHTSLPLHIFEPRYRTMLADAMAGERLLVVALAAGEDFHTTGTVGRIHDVEPLEDGRSNLRLEGLHRVEMTEIPSDTPYRQVQIKSLPEDLGAREPGLVESSKLELLASLGLLRSVANADSRPIVLHEHVGFEKVLNMTCAGMPIAARLRQELLEESDLMLRQRQALEHLSVVIEAISQLADQVGGESTPLN